MNSQALNIGIAGLHHDHVWTNLEDLAASNSANLVAVADPAAPLRKQATEKYSCAAYTDYREMVNGNELDAIYVFSSNADGADIAEWALGQKLHVLIEKPMAANLGGAKRMLRATQANNCRLMINWPIAWWPQLQEAIRLASNGLIGDLWQVKYRAAHEGPKEMGCTPYFYNWLFDEQKNGGGAMIDYCCYGSVLARVLLGMPERVTGIRGRLCKEDIDVDDNAILILHYRKAMATSEGSWTQIGKLTAYNTAIYGTKGTLLVEPGMSGRLLLATPENPDGKSLEVAAPPTHLKNATEHFIWGIQTGKPFQSKNDPDVCRDVQEILEAGIRSSNVNESVVLPIS